MVEDNITKILLNWNFYFLKPFLYVCFWYSEIIQSVLFCFAQARSSLPLRARHRASSPVRIHVSLRSVRIRSAPLLGSSSLSECKKAPNKSVLFRAGKGTRTLDPDLGKVVLYQLSYSRIDRRMSKTGAIIMNYFYLSINFYN